MSESGDKLSKAKILLVDDRVPNLFALKAIIEELDLTLVEAHSGDAALHCLLEDEFAVILLDVQMPGMDGFETARLIRMRKESRHTPIIFLTAHDTDRATIEKAYTLGAVDFLIKPLMPVVLLAKVRSFVELFQHKEEARRQAKLRESEHYFRLMADAAPVLIWISDVEKRCIWFNKPWLEFVGRRLDREIGSGWTANVHPDDVKRRQQCYTAAFDAREKFSLEYRLRRRDGQYRWLLDNGVPLSGSGGEFTGYIGSCIDITERKNAEETVRQAEEGLRRTTEQLRIVTESMSVAVTRCSRDFKYRSVSKLYAGWFGRTVEEILDRDIAEVIGARAFEQLRPYFEQVLAGQTVRYEEKIEFDTIGSRWVNAIYTPTVDARGVTDGWVGVNIDIEERKRMEVELHEADRRKNEFLAVLAHELRNPLAPIRNAVELLKLARDNTAMIEQARDVIERQLRHMVHLIDDLLDLGRITRGKIELRKERVDLTQIFRSALESTTPFFEAMDHELIMTLPEQPIQLDADPVRLTQVISNLLNNAAKYTVKGGRIWLAAERLGPQVLISIRDTGVGIAADQISRIFEMFSQVTPALERSQGGLGIGLALVKGLVELHGGTIEARSEGPGKGSEFRVTLPVVDIPAAESPQAGGNHAHGNRLAKYRILVVDDNCDSADTLAKMLSIVGHQTETAYDGLEAVQTAATFRPEVILLDIGLPHMNGYEAARHIRQQAWSKDTTLIALTGWGQERDKRRAMEVGFDHHLTKPVDPDALTMLIDSLHQAPP